MAATDQDYTIHRGGSYVFQFPLTDDDGSPLDPAGMGVHYRIAPRANHAAVLSVDDDTAEDPVTVALESPDYVASVPLTTERSLLLTAQTYHHELYLSDGDQLYPMMTGTLTITASQAARHGA